MTTPPPPRFLVVDSQRRCCLFVRELLGDSATVIAAGDRLEWRGLLGTSCELTGAIVAMRGGNHEMLALERLESMYPAVPVLRLCFEADRPPTSDHAGRELAAETVIAFALVTSEDERSRRARRRDVLDAIAGRVGWPPRERELVERLVVYGQTREEVEATMGLTRQSFRNTVSRLLERGGFDSLGALESHLLRELLRLSASEPEPA